MIQDHHGNILMKDNEIKELKNQVETLKESLELKDTEFRNIKSDIEAMEKDISSILFM